MTFASSFSLYTLYTINSLDNTATRPQDMSDQLAESSKELELELREELDMALGTGREAKRQRDAALETLADRELTITKFRELTRKLQEQCVELQNRLESSESTKGAAKGVFLLLL